MRKIIVNTALSSSLLFAGGDIAPIVEEPVADETPSWSFELMPYFAMSSLSGDSSVISSANSQIDLSFGNILDALEFSVPIHVEVQNKSGWGVWLDYSYMSLGGSGPVPNHLPYTVSVDVKQSIYEGYGIYRQTLKNGTFDYMAGIRRWKLKLDAEILGRPNINNTNNDWTDFVVGA